MGNKQHRYATNSIISERYNVNKVVDAEIESLKFQPKIQHKYKRNVYIQKFDEGNKPIQVDFLHNDGKLKSHIYFIVQITVLVIIRQFPILSMMKKGNLKK